LSDDLTVNGALIVHASATAWDTSPFPPEAVSQLSLEDIFIGMAAEVGPGL
jgi:hypothetical protein